jgi:hypothetical protein
MWKQGAMNRTDSEKMVRRDAPYALRWAKGVRPLFANLRTAARRLPALRALSAESLRDGISAAGEAARATSQEKKGQAGGLTYTEEVESLESRVERWWNEAQE